MIANTTAAITTPARGTAAFLRRFNVSLLRRDRQTADSYDFDGTASGRPFRPISCQVDERLSFLVQRPIEWQHKGSAVENRQPSKAEAQQEHSRVPAEPAG